MDPSELIISAEKQYKQILEGFFKSVYDENRLPSHGINHHRRVWMHARELIGVFNDVNAGQVESLIIASYLHDAGMCREPGPKHGWKSAELCQEFLLKHDLKENDFPGLIEAIIEHDNKEYVTGGSSLILKILSLADDLDAFGFTGIYRYLEIYFLRGIPIDSLSQMIRSNAANRFLNFERNLSSSGRIFDKHRDRYQVLDDFFSSLDNEKDASGSYHQVPNIILSLIREKRPVEHLFKMTSNNSIVTMFIEGLKEELL